MSRTSATCSDSLAQPLELAVFDGAQDLGLRRRAHVRDLVEEEGAAVGQLELSLHPLVGAR